MLRKKISTILVCLCVGLTTFSGVSFDSGNVVQAASYDSQFSNLSLARGYKDLSNGNPCVTSRFTADPGVMEYNGRVYVYTSHDDYMYQNGGVKDNDYSNINTINCMSSDDMANWTDHGAINVAGGSGAARWARNSWAPCAAHKKINGKEKFFLYFANSGGGIGVLTSDSPTGPWRDPIGRALISPQTPNCGNVTWLFDPAVIVDNDGTGYLYFGGGVPNGQSAHPKTARVVKLGSDMTSIQGTPQTIDAPYLFEDSGINKVGNTYYYTYCTNWDRRNNQWDPGIARIGYMTSNSPMGPFTYKGTCLNNPGDFFGVSGNNHHSIINFKNKNYIFYHAQWLDKQMKGTSKGYRSTHVNEINIGNGTISNARGDLKGVSQVQNLNPYQTNQMETMAWEGGIKVLGQNNTTVEMNRGDWEGVSNADFGSGAKSISMRASSRNGAVIKICAGSPSGPACGYVAIPGGNNFTNVTANVSGLTGVKKLFFVSSGDCTVDSWKFSKSGTVTPDPTPNPGQGQQGGQGQGQQGGQGQQQTSGLQNGWYYIKNVHAQKYLTVRNDNGKAGENVELVQGLGIKGQKWYVNNIGNGCITLKSALGEFMLDVTGNKNADGTNIEIYNAHGGNAEQFMLKGTADQRTFIVTTKSSNGTKALDDYNFQTANGSNVCQWAVGGQNNQKWVFEPTNN